MKPAKEVVPTTENGGLENVCDYRHVHNPFEEQMNYRFTRKSPAEIAKEDIREDEYQRVKIKLNSLTDHDTSSVLSSPKPEQSFVSTCEELGYGQQNYIEEGQKRLKVQASILRVCIFLYD